MTGISGIACILNELGYCHESLSLIKKSINGDSKDSTFKSGLSGIGIAMVYFFKKTSDRIFFLEAIRLGEQILKELELRKRNEWLKDNEIQFGLMNGYSGCSIFFCLLYELTQDNTYLKNAVDSIEDDLRVRALAIKTNYPDKGEQYHRNEAFILNAEISICICIDFLSKFTNTANFTSEIEQIFDGISNRFYIDSSFYRGIGNLFLLYAIDSEKISLEDIVSALDIFLVEKDGSVYLPTRGAYRLSSDFQSGASGILLGIECAIQKNPLNWLIIDLK